MALRFSRLQAGVPTLSVPLHPPRTVPMRLSLQLPALCLACSIWLPAGAQEPESRTSSQAEAPVRVVPAENVRFDYAQVLRAEPIYQTLRATRTAQRRDAAPVLERRPPVSGRV